MDLSLRPFNFNTMKKIYRANTGIAINVVLGSGKSTHVTFTHLSNGTSIFCTSDEDLQKAIEKHYKFGTLFRLKETIDESVAPEVKEEETTTEAEAESTVIKVTDLQGAKDYLADKFGISRTALKSKTSILNQASLHGITFEGLD